MNTRLQIPTLLALTLGLAPLVGCDEAPVGADGLDATEAGTGFETETDADAGTDAGIMTGVDTDAAPSDPEQPSGAEQLFTTPGETQLAGAAINLALGKPAVQSSTYAAAWASLAVDGNRDGNYDHGSVMHTNNPEESWWQVDLEGIQPVGEVVIWNRTDCCGERLHDFSVAVSSDLIRWEVFPYIGVAGQKTRIPIDRPVRWVKIHNPGVLNLAEVEVLRTRNMAYGKPTSQSSTALGAHSSRAVDGNADGNYENGSVMHTDNPGDNWWQVDLEAPVYVSAVAISNRTDCCGERLHDFYVSVSSDNVHWKHFFHAGGAWSTTHVLIGREARYVRITNPGVLNLAEVKVLQNLVYYHHLGAWYAAFSYKKDDGKFWGKGGLPIGFWDWYDIGAKERVEFKVWSAFGWYNKLLFDNYLEVGQVIKTGGPLWSETVWIEDA